MCGVGVLALGSSGLPPHPPQVVAPPPAPRAAASKCQAWGPPTMPDAAHLAGWVGLDSGRAGAKSQPEKEEGRAFWVPGVLSLLWSQAKAQANAHHLCSRPWSLPHPDAHSPLTCSDHGDTRVQRAGHWPGRWPGNRGVATGTTSLGTPARCLPQSPRAPCPVWCPPVTFMPRRVCQAQGGPWAQGRVTDTSTRENLKLSK